MNRSNALLFATIFAVVAFIVRFSPVPTNFACIGALGLFSFCYLRGWVAWAVPLGTMLLSEFVGHFAGVQDMGFYDPKSMACTYLGFTGMFAMGYALRGRKNPLLILSGATIGSLIFFFVSNFGSWLDSNSIYPKTFAGLWECYTLGIPFYRSTFNSDLFFTALFFGSFEIHSQLRTRDELAPERISK